MNKTNALRQLDTAGIAYSTIEYEVDESDLSGEHVVKLLQLDPEQVFKTLVCKDEKGNHHVFCIPVLEELDLKKCAQAAKVKRIEMIAVKELLPLTGYVRGGCSPVGMKKKFPTYFEETAMLYETIYCSAGLRGLQMQVDPNQLVEFLQAGYVHVIRD